MEPVGPDGQIGPFSRSNEPRCGLNTHFADFRTGKPTHFHGQMIPGASKPPDLPIFVNILWTSFKTLAMELVGPNEKNDPFSMSNKPRSK
ncbi:hypothetical protein H5410_056510 [Solanum commersonii]|uniref:Uncharacterized protein n=1 Tax=Solanum commersonii TaxID=4109 RepID=A0A9J5WMV9_SOLCO|nr:hypothetical protein H5410_056510 [Solanum commersonii]